MFSSVNTTKKIWSRKIDCMFPHISELRYFKRKFQGVSQLPSCIKNSQLRSLDLRYLFIVTREGLVVSKAIRKKMVL